MTLADYRRWATTTNETTPDLSIVIPTYNEEWRILPTIGAIATHVSSMELTWEMIIADDGSTDATIELVRALELVNLRVLVAERNGGKGSAVRRGVHAASGGYVLFVDADQSTPIEQLDLLLEPVMAGRADIAVGSRAASGANVQSKGLLRRMMSWGLRSLVRSVYPIRIEDTQCGFKLFSAESAAALFDLQLVDGFSFDLEVLYLAHRLRFEVIEIPVDWIDAPGSTVDPGKVAVRFVLDLILVRVNEVRGRYRLPTGDLATTGTTERNAPLEGQSPWTSSAKDDDRASSASGADSTPTRSRSSLRLSIN